jgi:hypothetical protein
MATYGDMQTRIASELHRTGITSSIQAAILSAVAFYANERFSGNEKRGTITTIAGTRIYTTATASPGTLPTDIAEIDSIVATVNGRDYKLQKTTYEHLEDIDGGATLTTGDPRMWAWYAGSLRLYPTPTSAVVLTLSYQTILTALSADADTNFWTTTAEALIRSRAKKELALHVLFDDELATRMGAMEREELYQVRKLSSKLIAGGRLKATPF